MDTGGSVAGWGLVAQGGVAVVVVVVFPVADDYLGVGQRPEAGDVEAFVADAGVERFDVAVAPGLSGRNEVQTNLPRSRVSHGAASQFGPVVTAQHRRECAALGGQAVEFSDQVLAGDAALDHPAETFAGVLVDDRHDLDRPPIGG
jgi:hypothetical protein